MGIQRFLSSSLVFLGMTTIFLSNTSEAFNPVRPLGGHNIANSAQWCRQTDYPILCNFMLKTLRSGTCEQATVAAISATIFEVNKAKGYVAKLLQGRVAQGKQELGVCLEVYGTAIDDLNTSLRNLKDKSVPDLLTNLSAATSDISACDDALKEAGLVSPVGKLNQRLTQYTSNSLALATVLNH